VISISFTFRVYFPYVLFQVPVPDASVTVAAYSSNSRLGERRGEIGKLQAV